MTKQAQTERTQSAYEMLHKYLQPGDTVYCVLRHVSKSGMQRRIDFYTMKDNRPCYLTGYMEAIGLGKRGRKDQGLVVNGCGMDMGFHLVNNLSIKLFCPNGYTHEGAYALKHEWI